MAPQANTRGHHRDSSRGSNETIRAESTTQSTSQKITGRTKNCNLWVHNENYTREDVLLDLDLLGKDFIKPGDLIEVGPASSEPETRDFQDRNGIVSRDENTANGVLRAFTESSSRKGTRTLKSSTRTGNVSLSASPNYQSASRYVFVAKAPPEEVRARATGLQISLLSTIANTFGWRYHDNVTIAIADQDEHTASHVEIVFRDVYLSRADMWRLALTELCGKTVYKGQKLTFLGTIRATIKSIYAHGRRVYSAYFSSSTLPIFRSESARYVIFIQMSREMWDFDSEGTGEIMFSKVIDGFLPELFKRWMNLEARHLVSIVMFARFEYDHHQLASLGQLHSADLKSSQFDSGRTKYKDFYRVVVSDMASGQWTLILNALKKEFRVFLRDISIQETTLLAEKPDSTISGKPRIAGRPSLALRGNILEAINIAASQFGRDYIDRDLVRTGISVVIITPGPGIFEVDRDLLHLTSESMTNNGMGIDLVCLSRMPLHSVPLFKYRSPHGTSDIHHHDAKDRMPLLHINRLSSSPSTAFLSTTPRSGSMASKFQYLTEKWLYGIPQWIDVSFWAAESEEGDAYLGSSWDSSHATYLDSKFTKSFVPQVRMYELQMMGVMETGMANISIPYMSEGPQGLQKKARIPASRRHLNLKASHRHLGVLSSSLRSQSGFPEHGESPQSSMKGAQALAAAHVRTSKHKLERMDEYDRYLFQMHPKSKRAESRIKGTTAPVLVPGPAAAIAASRIKKSDSNLITTSSTTPKREKPVPSVSEKTSKSRVDEHTAPNPRPRTTPLQKVGGNRTARSISFAFRGLSTTAPRALASTSINAENISAAGMSKGDVSTSRISSAVSTKSPESVKQRSTDRSSLDSESSDHSESSRPSTRRARSPSRPISIKRSKANLANVYRDDIPDTFSTATTKAERDREDNDAVQDPKASSTVGSVAHSPVPGPAKLVPQPPLRENVSPWIKNVNPSNPKKNDPNATLSFGRWQHVFPRTPRTSTMKWRSLCTPASVPLTTEVFPTRAELENDYEQTPYTIHQETDSELLEVPKSRETLLKEMVSLRMDHGYQVVVGQAVADAAGMEVVPFDHLYETDKLAQDGNVLIMTMGNTIQKLAFSDGKDIHITKYVRRTGTEKRPTRMDYGPSIRTILSSSYSIRPLEIGGYNEEYSWSQADAFIAGRKAYNQHTAEQLRFWRARFVLIPVDPPPNAKKGIQIMGHDTAEEIHLTGLIFLTQLWQKNRYIPDGENVVKLTVGKRKDPNPLDILFQTRNPSEVVAGELDRLLDVEERGPTVPKQLLPETELFDRSRFSLPRLAQVIQSERGVEIVSRRWHLRLHYNCFIGSDFTTWLMQNFRDVESRDEAVLLGNELMERKLFVHVEQRHKFRDGNYFYQITPEFREHRPDSKSSWFPGRRPERSVPSTPMSETMNRDSPLGTRSRSESSNNLDSLSSDSPLSTPTKATKARHSIALSKVIRINVDPRNRSKRPEIVDLHYDRLHNPENCYHIELSWINVTSKLVEDAIVQWATTSEKYGLKLVEVPIEEISSISKREPFRAPYHIYLKLPPPASQPTPTYYSTTSLGPQAGAPDQHYYQRMLLKRLNFVLDLEAASDFPLDVDVTYSWGRVEYRYSQYIHRSGTILIQIADDGHFILLANRLYNTRSAFSKDLHSANKGEHSIRGEPPHFQRRPPLPPSSQHPTQAHISTLGSLSTGSANNSGPNPVPNPLSPHPSPLVRAHPDVLGSAKDSRFTSTLHGCIIPEDIKDELESLCSDASWLESFYKEVTLPGTSVSGSSGTGGKGTGRQASATPTIAEERPDDDAELDASIPSLVLPASIVGSPVLSKQRRPSPRITHSSKSGISNDAPSSATTTNSRPSPSSATTAQNRRRSEFPPSPAISAISAAIEASPQLIGRDPSRPPSGQVPTPAAAQGSSPILEPVKEERPASSSTVSQSTQGQMSERPTPKGDDGLDEDAVGYGYYW